MSLGLCITLEERSFHREPELYHTLFHLSAAHIPHEGKQHQMKQTETNEPTNNPPLYSGCSIRCNTVFSFHQKILRTKNLQLHIHYLVDLVYIFSIFFVRTLQIKIFSYI